MKTQEGTGAIAVGAEVSEEPPLSSSFSSSLEQQQRPAVSTVTFPPPPVAAGSTDEPKPRPGEPEESVPGNDQDEDGDDGDINVAAEAEKLVGGVAIDRMRSRSSRSFAEVAQSREVKGDTQIRGEELLAKDDNKGVPPELVVAEDQEVRTKLLTFEDVLRRMEIKQEAPFFPFFAVFGCYIPYLYCYIHHFYCYILLFYFCFSSRVAN